MSEAVVVGMKRKRDDGDDDSGNPKRLCKSAVPGPSDSTTTSHSTPKSSKGKRSRAKKVSESERAADPAEPAKMLPGAEKDSKRKGQPKARNKHIQVPLKPKPTIIKLAPNRPYPSVPTSSSATGPRSKRKEGNNKICVTRNTDLGAYLTRCKDVFVKQG
jgi:ribonuclease P/MRP protein subunit RPP20